jgi:predicted ATPase
LTSLAPLPEGKQLEVSEWHVRNFKSIDSCNLPLAPLTVLTGANSSGKSSLLQSLLLFAQSIRENAPVLNGSLVTLGNAPDVVSSGSSSLTLGATFSSTGEARWQGLAFYVTLQASADLLAPSSIVLTLGGENLLSASRRVDPTNPAAEGVSLHSLSVTALHGRETLEQRMKASLVLGGLLPEFVVFDASVESQGQDLMDLLTSVLNPVPAQGFRNALIFRDFVAELLNQPEAEKVLRGRLLTATKKAVTSLEGLLALAGVLTDDQRKWFVFLEAAGHLFRNRVVAVEPVAPLRSEGRRSRLSEPSRDWMEMLHILDAVRTALRTFADSIAYLGPLRAEPRVVYQIGQGAKGLPVGLRGEYAAGLLARTHTRRITYRGPNGEENQGSIGSAVSAWAQYLGIADDVAASSVGKLGHGLEVTLHGAQRDLTTIGVGASQLLPVVVLVFSVASETLLLLEQPELHLHPAVQSRLADFLLIARPDLRFIVETHSEYLVTRLRLRVAERRAEPSALGLYFAENPNGHTAFTRLAVSELGDFEHWPEGFFDAGHLDSRDIVAAIASRLGAGDSGTP